MGRGGEQRIAHVLCIPASERSHITPLFKFCKQIARKGIIITFVSYEDSISRIREKESSSELQSLGIRLFSLEKSDGKGSDGPKMSSEKFERAFRPFRATLANHKLNGTLDFTSILSDLFFEWTQDVADELQIPRYLFFASGANLARYLQCCAELCVQGKFKFSEDDKLVDEGEIPMPGLPSLAYHELLESTRVGSRSQVLSSFKVWQASGVLVQSFEELDPKALESWRKPRHPGFEEIKVPKIYPIGPIADVFSDLDSISVANSAEDEGARSLRWLASQPRSSVLYVAFGCLITVSAENIKELALGLESSNERFLWVVPEPKPGSSIRDVLPPGFQERVGDRGCLCIGWAPQVQILAHSSTGGFLTHAGWNSCLESISLGVPMITWPQVGDQPLNNRFLVDELKIACQIGRASNWMFRREEVKQAVRLLMVESPLRNEMRSRAAAWKMKVAVAVAEGGSRGQAVEEFTADLLFQSEPAAN